jgi:SAM-dependent methyltransferase
MIGCPFCQSRDTELFHMSEDREYHLCQNCDLVFVPEKFFLSVKQEKEKYDNHQNSLENQGYCDFLDKLLLPLETHLTVDAKGLDFGSGPGPTLFLLMQQRGYAMDIYDIFYHDNKSVFDKEYDFITSTEVIEHLHEPLREIERLWDCLKEGGVLGLMTAFRVETFSTWYYKRDLTHIRFFTPKSFSWLAGHLGAKLEIPTSGVVILKKESYVQREEKNKS